MPFGAYTPPGRPENQAHGGERDGGGNSRRTNPVSLLVIVSCSAIYSQLGWAGARDSGPRTRISTDHPPALMRGELTPSISHHAAIRAHRNCGTADRSWIPPAAHARQAGPLSGIILMTTRANTIGSKRSAHTWQPCSPFSAPLSNLPICHSSAFLCVRHTSLTRQRVTTPAPSPPVTRRLSGTVAMSHQGEISRPCCP